MWHEVPTFDDSSSADMYSSVRVPMNKVSLIEKGRWSDVVQDWRAVLVLNDGARVQTAWWYRDAAAKVAQLQSER